MEILELNGAMETMEDYGWEAFCSHHDSENIKQKLRAKIDDWLGSIDDEDLAEDIRNSCIVTGGAIASLVQGEEPNDYDIYFTNKDVVKRVAEYYTEEFVARRVDANYLSVVEEDGRVFIRVSHRLRDEIRESTKSETERYIAKILNFEKAPKEEYDLVHISDNAISLSGDIQLILRFYGDHKEIHKNFDFAHCTNYWVSETNELVLLESAINSIADKELCYIGSLYPVSSIIRTRKFIERGFSCRASEYLKMCFQVSKLDMSNTEVLREQLVGIDATYFDSLISRIEVLQEGDEGFRLDYEKLMSLI